MKRPVQCTEQAIGCKTYVVYAATSFLESCNTWIVRYIVRSNLWDGKRTVTTTICNKNTQNLMKPPLQCVEERTRQCAEVTFCPLKMHCVETTTFRSQALSQSFTKYCPVHQNFIKYWTCSACHWGRHSNFIKYCRRHERIQFFSLLFSFPSILHSSILYSFLFYFLLFDSFLFYSLLFPSILDSAMLFSSILSPLLFFSPPILYSSMLDSSILYSSLLHYLTTLCAMSYMGSFK